MAEDLLFSCPTKAPAKNKEKKKTLFKLTVFMDDIMFKNIVPKHWSALCWLAAVS